MTVKPLLIRNRPMKPFSFRHCLVTTVSLSSLLYCAVASAQLPAPSLRPDGGVWNVGTGFEFALKENKALKARRSLSGIACNKNTAGEPICLMAFDEGSQARYATVSPGQLTPDPQPVVLATQPGELDAEAAATDGKYLYVTGSHSAKRADCSSNPSSRHVFRLTLDPATGRGKPESLTESGRLWDIMTTVPLLKDHVGERQCLGSSPSQRGINIEGMAVRDARLYFGLRGPVIDAEAWVLSVASSALFGSADAAPQLSRLALGPNRGIRDMVAVEDGFLLLAGPDDGKASQGVPWTINWWDGQGNTASAAVPRRLATLDLSAVALRACDTELKPEALAVLEQTAQNYRVVVLSDGMCDGGPLTFTVPR